MEGWENEFCVRVALENYSARASDCGGIHITATKKVVSAMREGIASLGNRPEMTSAQSTGFLREYPETSLRNVTEASASVRKIISASIRKMSPDAIFASASVRVSFFYLR